MQNTKLVSIGLNNTAKTKQVLALESLLKAAFRLTFSNTYKL